MLCSAWSTPPIPGSGPPSMVADGGRQPFWSTEWSGSSLPAKTAQTWAARSSRARSRIGIQSGMLSYRLSRTTSARVTSDESLRTVMHSAWDRRPWSMSPGKSCSPRTAARASWRQLSTIAKSCGFDSSSRDGMPAFDMLMLRVSRNRSSSAGPRDDVVSRPARGFAAATACRHHARAALRKR